MNKYRGLIAFSLAIIFGLLAVVLANRWLTTRDKQPTVAIKETAPLARIVVAAKELGVGTRLNKETLTFTDWPKANLPKGVFYDIAILEKRVAVTRILAGQPVVDAALAEPGSGAGLVAKIPSGKRAIAISVDEVRGVAGFILPDSSVDIYCIESYGGDKVAKTILENVKVLAIAQEAVKADGKPKIVHTVTLEVEPKQAETLALQSAKKGSMHLALRTPLDNLEQTPPVVASTAPPATNRLKPKRQVYSAPKSSPYTVFVIRGSAKPEEVKFESIDSDERVNSGRRK